MLGSGGDKAYGIALDRNGMVAITGTFADPGKFDEFPVLAMGGGDDIFVVRRSLEPSPTQATVVGGHILHVQGTNADSTVNFVDNGQGRIGVTIDEEAMRVFTGITRIEFDGRGGNDMVSIWDPNLMGDPNDINQPADVSIDLGSGDNEFTVAAMIGSQYVPAASAWHIDVTAGGGNDQVQTDTQSSIPIAMTADLGSGDNGLTATWYHPGTGMPVPDGLTVRGGSGKDDVRVAYTFGLDPDEPAIPQLQAPVTVSIDGGGGTNSVFVDWLFDVEPGTAGAGSLAFDIPIVTDIRNASDAGVAYGFSPGSGGPGLVFNAPIVTTVDSGRGDSTMSFKFFHQTAFDAMPPEVFVNNSLTINMLGGAGRQVMDLTIGSGDLGAIIPSIMPAGSVRAVLDGGADSDTIRANMWFDPRSMGRLDAQGLGGRGDDYLTLNIFGCPDDHTRGLLDGGPGLDTAHATGNVRVIDCERIV